MGNLVHIDQVIAVIVLIVHLVTGRRLDYLFINHKILN